jgi:hypothetical protein
MLNERFIMLDKMVLLVDDKKPNRIGDQYVWISNDEKHIIENSDALKQIDEKPSTFFSRHKMINIVWCFIPEDIKKNYLVTVKYNFD